jgi:hypothetical protein
MWMFYPRLPTKEAWDNRIFHDQLSVKDMCKTLKESKLIIKGQLYSKDDPDTYHIFQNLNDLETLLKLYEYEKNVSELFIWNVGYFRNVTIKK